MEATSVNFRKLDKRHTINVTINIMREFKIRIFIAKVLIRIAGFVLGCGIKVKRREL